MPSPLYILFEGRGGIKWVRWFVPHQAELHHRQAMHDPAMTEEHVGLLGDEGLRAGGQALRLGWGSNP